MAMKAEMWMVLFVVHACAVLLLMNENGYAIAEDREDRADRDGNHTHRPHVNPYRYAKCGRRCGCHRTAESGNNTHAE